MSVIAHHRDDVGRLTLALLLALGLHAALLFGIPADWRPIRFPEPLRFEVVLRPPVERPNVSEPTAAPASSAPETDPATAPDSVVTPPEPAPTTPPEPAPAAAPPPAPTPRPQPLAVAEPAPSTPPKPAQRIKPTPKPAAPIKPPTATKITPAPRATVKPAASPKPAKSPEKLESDLPDKLPVNPRKTVPPRAKPAVPVTAKSAPMALAPEPARTIRRPERPDRSRATAETGARDRLDSSALLGQIASLETETGRRANAGVRGKRVNPNDTQSLEGFYIAAWVRKVEQIGAMNFPDIARKLDLNTGPVLDVSIRADGSLKDVRVVRSSGNAELDRAAQRIVKLGAPYSPFPPQLRQQYDVLYISRPWRFEAQGRMRAR